jgi:hypothetical protein
MSDFSKLVGLYLLWVEKAPLANLGLDRINHLITNIPLMYTAGLTQHPSSQKQFKDLEDIDVRDGFGQLKVELV